MLVLRTRRMLSRSTCEVVFVQFQADNPALRVGGNAVPRLHRLRRFPTAFTLPALLERQYATRLRTTHLSFGTIRSVEKGAQNLAVKTDGTCTI